MRLHAVSELRFEMAAAPAHTSNFVRQIAVAAAAVSVALCVLIPGCLRLGPATGLPCAIRTTFWAPVNGYAYLNSYLEALTTVIRRS